MLPILLLTTLFAILIVKQYLDCKRLPKGPTPLPIIGNLHQLVYYIYKHGGIIEGYKVIGEKYGKVFTIWIGPLPSVYITDYGVAHETHVKRAHIFGARYAPGIMGFIRNGRGVVASNGDFWVEHRRFALTTLRNFGVGRNLMEEKIMDEYRYRIADFKKSNNNNKNEDFEVNINNFSDLLIGSIINQLLVSERFEQNDEEFQRLKKGISESLQVVSLLDTFLPTSILESRFMKWRQDTVFLPFRTIHEIATRSANKRFHQIEIGEHTVDDNVNDFVDAYIAKMKKDEKDGIDSTYTLENLAIDIYDLWIAGQETTSTTITWACLCFLHHPKVVEKVRDETLKVTNGNRSLSLSDKTLTPYLNATINEVQRIASILNINLFRWIDQDTVIDGQPLKGGTALTTNIGMIHADEKLFREPSKFYPERFIENKDLEKQLMAFGIGKRSCLGESLARAELYLIIGNLLMEYNIEAVGEIPELKTTSPFAMMKRPPNFDVRFVYVNN